MKRFLDSASVVMHYLLAGIFIYPGLSTVCFRDILLGMAAAIPFLLAGYFLKNRKAYAYCCSFAVLECCTITGAILGIPLLVVLLNSDVREEFGIKGHVVRIWGTFIGVVLAAISAFLVTFGVCYWIDSVNAFGLAGLGAVGWIFCFITVPIGGLIGGIIGQNIFFKLAEKKLAL